MVKSVKTTLIGGNPAVSLESLLGFNGPFKKIILTAGSVTVFIGDLNTTDSNFGKSIQASSVPKSEEFVFESCCLLASEIYVVSTSNANLTVLAYD